MKKKLLALLLSSAMVVSMTACGGNSGKTDADVPANAPAETSEAETTQA